MFYPHTRSLGAQSGVQLDPVRDNTDGFTSGTGDQIAAVVGRFKRGRIDVPFKVHRGNIRTKLGAPESLRVSPLNESYVQLYEAVNNGAAEAVVMRLTTEAAKNSYAVFTIASENGASSFTVSPNVPTSAYLFYLRDLECFNDGIKIEVTAQKTVDAASPTTPVASKIVTVRVREPNGSLRYEVTGSLDKTATDEYGQDYYLGTLFQTVTSGAIEFVAADGASVDPKADCYGKNADGSEKLGTSGKNPIVLFSEGGTGYQNADYDRAVSALENSTFDYGYGFSGGSEAIALLRKLADMHIRANRSFIIDIPGGLSPEAAQTFIGQLSLDSHYVHVYWAPLKTDDPLNGGKAIIGLGGYQAGLRCARNARTNSYGIAPKNYPIAGKEWPLNRTGVEQLITPSDPQMNDLALAQINPVLYERYNGGGKYVFRDSLTSAKVSTSYRKLISVAEMSSTLDDMVSKYGKEVLQLPMEIAIDKMEKFMKFTLGAMKSSGWIVASNEPELGEAGFAFTVVRNQQRPADRMDVRYGVHYDGVNRAVFIQQTISQ